MMTMKTVNHKAYMIPETELLSLESVGSLMGANDISGNGTGDPAKPSPGKFGTPARVLYV